MGLVFGSAIAVAVRPDGAVMQLRALEVELPCCFRSCLRKVELSRHAPLPARDIERLKNP